SSGNLRRAAGTADAGRGAEDTSYDRRQDRRGAPSTGQRDLEKGVTEARRQGALLRGQERGSEENPEANQEGPRARPPALRYRHFRRDVSRRTHLRRRSDDETGPAMLDRTSLLVHAKRIHSSLGHGL